MEAHVQSNADGERVISHMFNADWACRTQCAVELGHKLLALSLYSDCSHVSEGGFLSFHPIYCGLQNLKEGARFKHRNLVLVALIPILRETEELKGPDLTLAQTELSHTVYDIVCKSIISKGRAPLRMVDCLGDTVLVRVILATFIGDLKELSTFTLSKGYPGNYPDANYLVKRGELGDIHTPLFDCQKRTEALANKLLRSGTAESLSFLPLENKLFGQSLVPNLFDIAGSPDSCHVIGLGMLLHFFKAIRAIVGEKHGRNWKSVLRTIKTRMKELPRFGDFRFPTSGVFSARLKSWQRVNMLRVLPCVLIGLQLEGCIQALLAFLRWHDMATSSSYTLLDLAKEDTLRIDSQEQSLTVFSAHLPTKLRIPK